MTNPTGNALTANEQSQAVEREAAVPGGVAEQAREIVGRLRESSRGFGHGGCQGCMDSERDEAADVIERLLATAAHRPPQPEREAAVPGGAAALCREILAGDYEGSTRAEKLFDDGMRQAAQMILAELAHRPHQPGVVTEERRWQHVVRGTFYTEIGRGELQGHGYFGEGAELVCYRGDDGRLWFRPVREFDDGRFVAAPSPGASVTASPADEDVIEALREIDRRLEILVRDQPKMTRPQVREGAADMRDLLRPALTRLEASQPTAETAESGQKFTSQNSDWCGGCGRGWTWVNGREHRLALDRIRELEGEVAAAHADAQARRAQSIENWRSFKSAEARAGRLTTAAQAARDALEPFAKAAAKVMPNVTDDIYWTSAPYEVRVGDLRRAREALAPLASVLDGGEG